MRPTSRARATLADDQGMSLADVLVGVTLAMIVTSLLVAGAVGVYRTNNYTTQDTDALDQLRNGIDRMGKELRQARKVYNATSPLNSGPRKLAFWVDYDQDNQQDLNERIIWEVVAAGSKAELRRSTQVGGDTRTVARDVVLADAFVYSDPADPSKSTSVTITLSTDPAGSLTKNRTITTQVRLRNATLE